MGTMITRVNGIAISVTTDAKFTVSAGDEFDTFSTDNEKGNYSKVVALNEAMRCVIDNDARSRGVYIDSDFPFEDTTEWVAIATANGFVK